MVVVGLYCILWSRASALPILQDAWFSPTCCLLRQTYSRWVLHSSYGDQVGMCGTAGSSPASPFLFRPLYMANVGFITGCHSRETFPMTAIFSSSPRGTDEHCLRFFFFKFSLWSHFYCILLIKQCAKTSWNSRRVRRIKCIHTILMHRGIEVMIVGSGRAFLFIRVRNFSSDNSMHLVKRKREKNTGFSSREI